MIGTNNGQPAIQVTNLSKNYGSQVAVNNITFTAQAGSILGFLGPNGAGKSTTMRMLTGYLPQSSGKASVCGFDIQIQSLEARKNMGYLPENNPLYPEMYVKEFLDFVANIHQIKNKKQRIAEVITLTGLQTEQHKKIAQLSKGYKQRVGLAQAIIHNPQVLILDEPTSGLDPNQLIEIRSLIKELGKTKTVILSTHIMQEVEAICDRVIIINKGNIVADDLLANLISKHGEKTLEPVFVKLTKAQNR
ncbi:MAG: ATP-binding cassette domain-containing protein [Sphingobacteriales bacterium]|nr:MAG: ATP-binding cassette domain-containing protein [Sphingobacteriales bacterium]TAF81620.1 MAG: ATP-binding cassette domain-containing protein [Sphingobacteriales bacterium]